MAQKKSSQSVKKVPLGFRGFRAVFLLVTTCAHESFLQIVVHQQAMSCRFMDYAQMKISSTHLIDCLAQKFLEPQNKYLNHFVYFKGNNQMYQTTKLFY